VIARIGTACAWLAAGVIALAVYHRLRRGRRVVLTGRFSPRLVRMIVIVLVMFGIGGERDGKGAARAHAPMLGQGPGSPRAQEPGSQLPAKVTVETVQSWVGQQHSESWLAAKRQALERAGAGDGTRPVQPLPFDAPRTAPAALQVLDRMERVGCYDPWLVAYLWRQTSQFAAADAAARVTLLARLHEHARIANALIAAHGQMKPLLQLPPGWLNKGGPRREELAPFQRSAAELLRIARELYPKTDAGTWLRDGVVQLTLAKGSRAPVLVRAGTRAPMPAGAPLRFCRLDLLVTDAEAGAVLEHDGFGHVVLPPGASVGAWELASLLSKAGTEAVRVAVATALAGDEAAALRLERALPLVHRELRIALLREPQAKGAPRLRLILALFDDVPMWVIPSATKEPGQAGR
jgi:hypothetical protein